MFAHTHNIYSFVFSILWLFFFIARPSIERKERFRIDRQMLPDVKIFSSGVSRGAKNKSVTNASREKKDEVGKMETGGKVDSTLRMLFFRASKLWKDVKLLPSWRNNCLSLYSLILFLCSMLLYSYFRATLFNLFTELYSFIRPLCLFFIIFFIIY